MNLLISDDYAPCGQGDVAAVEIGDKSTRLTHQDNPGCHVPWRETALPIGIETTRGDPGEIEGSCSEPSQTGDVLLRGDVLVAGKHGIAPAGMGKRAGDNRLRELLAGSYAQPAIV